MRGPGFYFLAMHMESHMDPTYQILQQLCSQEGHKLPFSHDIDILLPENKFIDNLQSLRDRGIVSCISSHQNCGAAKRGHQTYLVDAEAIDIPADIVKKILSQLPQRVIERTREVVFKNIEL